MTNAATESLKAYIGKLKGWYIAEKADYSQYTEEDQSKAVAFRLLASAALEGHIERRLLECAEGGLERLRRSQPTTSGRNVLTWYLYSRRTLHVPVYQNDILGRIQYIDLAKEKYNNAIKKNHGMSGEDLENLTIPLGVNETDIDVAFVQSLQTLAERRNPASHIRVNRARSMTEPKAEWDLISGTFPHLIALDETLDNLTNIYSPPT